MGLKDPGPTNNRPRDEVLRDGIEPPASTVSRWRSTKAELPERSGSWIRTSACVAYEATEDDRSSIPQCRREDSNLHLGPGRKLHGCSFGVIGFVVSMWV